MSVMRQFSRQFLAIAMLLLLLAACGRGRGAEPTPTSPTTGAAMPAAEAPAAEATVAEATQPAAPTEAAAQAAPVSGDPLAAVLAAQQAQLNGGPYRATTTIDADGTITEMVAEVIPPDTMHITIGGGNMEMIMVEGTLWTKSGESPWAQMGSPEMMQGILDSVQEQFGADTLSNVQHLGAEPVFGEQTELYSFTSTLGEGEDAVVSEVRLWVSQATGLPVRLEMTGTAMGVTSHTVQSIEYDDSITVTPPAQ